jgi:hypothetical protein
MNCQGLFGLPLKNCLGENTMVSLNIRQGTVVRDLRSFLGKEYMLPKIGLGRPLVAANFP